MSVNRNFTRTLSGANTFTIDNLNLASHKNTIRINGNSGNIGDVIGKDKNNRLVFQSLEPFVIDPNSIDGTKLTDNISITTTGNYNGNSINLTGDLQVDNDVNIDGNLTYAGDLNIDDLIVDSLTLDPDFVGNGNINLNQHQIIGNYSELNINGNTGGIVCFQLTTKDSVLIEDDLEVVGNIDTSGNLTLTTGNIELTAGSINLTAGNVIASAGDMECVDFEATGEITGGDNITIIGNYSSTDGNITLTNGNISVVDNTATNGFFDDITLPKTGSAVITLASSTGNINTTGNFTTTAGNLETTSGNIFTTNGDIHANNGYVRGDVLRFLTKLQFGDSATPSIYLDNTEFNAGTNLITTSHTGSYASNDFALELTEANSHAKIGGNLKVDGTIFGNIVGEVSETHVNCQSLRVHDLGDEGGNTGLQVEDGYDIRMYSDAGTTKTIELDSSNGNITITGTLYGNVEGEISEDHINGQSLTIENLGVAGDTGIEVHDGFDISTFSDAGTTKTFSIDGSTGDYNSKDGDITLTNGDITLTNGDITLTNGTMNCEDLNVDNHTGTIEFNNVDANNIDCTHLDTDRVKTDLLQLPRTGSANFTLNSTTMNFASAYNITGSTTNATLQSLNTTGNITTSTGDITATIGDITATDGSFISNKAGSTPAPTDGTYTDWSLNISDDDGHGYVGGNLIVGGSIYGDVVGSITEEIVDCQRLNIRDGGVSGDTGINIEGGNDIDFFNSSSQKILEISGNTTGSTTIGIFDAGTTNLNFQITPLGSINRVNNILHYGSVINMVNSGTLLMNDGLITDTAGGGSSQQMIIDFNNKFIKMRNTNVDRIDIDTTDIRLNNDIQTETIHLLSQSGNIQTSGNINLTSGNITCEGTITANDDITANELIVCNSDLHGSNTKTGDIYNSEQRYFDINGRYNTHTLTGTFRDYNILRASAVRDITIVFDSAFSNTSTKYTNVTSFNLQNLTAPSTICRITLDFMFLNAGGSPDLKCRIDNSSTGANVYSNGGTTKELIYTGSLGTNNERAIRHSFYITGLQVGTDYDFYPKFAHTRSSTQTAKIVYGAENGDAVIYAEWLDDYNGSVLDPYAPSDDY